MKSRSDRGASPRDVGYDAHASLISQALVHPFRHSQWLLDRIAFAFSQQLGVADARGQWLRGEQLALLVLVAIGAILRMWGLGAVGLHGEDEHTTTLAALHVLEDGTPRFPSGMFYTRAIVQSYLIAGSVHLFGDSEWAIRLPSALCGVLVIPLAYFAGRRFLQPVWNLAFVATVALCPELILISQNARMYVFFVATIAAFMALLFRWERTWRTRDLCWAVAMLILALQFQVLAVFGLLLLFFPPLVRGDPRRLRDASVAAAACVVAYLTIDHWNGAFYFERAEDYGERLVQAAAVSTSYEQMPFGILIGSSAVAALASWAGSTAGKTITTRTALAALFLFALAAQLTFNYHIAALAYLLAIVIAMRLNGALPRALLAPLALSAVILIYHWILLRNTGVTNPRLIIGALVGKPSVWAYINFAKLSYMSAIVAAVGCVHAIAAIARNGRVSDYWLLFLLGVWMPLLVIGFFQWYPAPRYTIGLFLPLLLCAFATAQRAVSVFNRASDRQSHAFQAVAALTAVSLAINPAALAKAVDSGYDVHPDHKGAAEFVRSLHLHPDDRVLAEDVLMQTYYLKHVDYWLTARRVAAPFVQKVDGRYVDGYTHTAVIGSGAELQSLVNSRDRGALYVITSAEQGGAEKRYIEGEGIYETLRSGSFKKIFVGRDGQTLVWMSASPRDSGRAGSQ